MALEGDGIGSRLALRSDATAPAMVYSAVNTARHIRVANIQLDGRRPDFDKSCTATASDDTITCANHGFTAGTMVRFRELSGGAGIQAGNWYWVMNPTTNTFQVAANSAMSFAVNITSDTSRQQSWCRNASTLRRVRPLLELDRHWAVCRFTVTCIDLRPYPLLPE
jgi:hypothetical protein